MARYRILYWEHIPMGVKASDVNGVVRKNLPPRFQEAHERAASRMGNEASEYTSMFTWGDEHEIEGSASAVAEKVVDMLNKEWHEDKALSLYEKRGERMF